jgi:PAS domain S-box-containing protein
LASTLTETTMHTVTQKRPGDLPRALEEIFARTRVALALSEDGERDPEVPLVLVNEPFTALTGYPEAEVLGRNCRFLQGPETSAEARRELHAFIHDPSAERGRFAVLNYRRDGRTFENLVFMSRLRDGAGRPRYILASQFDMTEALARSRLERNDAELSRRLAEVQEAGRHCGLAMTDSARLLSDSLTTPARLSLERRS